MPKQQAPLTIAHHPYIGDETAHARRLTCGIEMDGYRRRGNR